MGVSVKWDNSEKTVIRYIFKGDWSLADYDKCIETSFKFTETVPHQVDVILDMTQSSAKMPNGFLLYFRRKLDYVPANRGDFVIAGQSSIVKATVRILRSNMKSISHRIMDANTLNEARAILKEGSTLPAKPAGFLDALEAAQRSQ